MKTVLQIYENARHDYWKNPHRFMSNGLANQQWNYAKREADIRARWESAEA